MPTSGVVGEPGRKEWSQFLNRVAPWPVAEGAGDERWKAYRTKQFEDTPRKAGESDEQWRERLAGIFAQELPWSS